MVHGNTEFRSSKDRQPRSSAQVDSPQVDRTGRMAIKGETARFEHLWRLPLPSHPCKCFLRSPLQLLLLFTSSKNSDSSESGIEDDFPEIETQLDFIDELQLFSGDNDILSPYTIVLEKSSRSLSRWALLSIPTTIGCASPPSMTTLSRSVYKIHHSCV